MKRRFGMIFCVLCILIVGMSVTKMTTTFVASQSVAAPAEAAVAGAGMIPEIARAGVITEMDAPAMAAMITEETLPEQDGAAAYSEEEEAITDMEEVANRIAEAKPVMAKNESIQETVKSPLDPVVETKPALLDAADATSMRMVEDFFARFAAAEESSIKIWEMASTDNLVAYSAAAEQERVLWDYELNLIYGEILSRMSKEEAENLKHLELEWIKERDMYAEKVVSRSPMTNGQKQDPAYIRTLAEKTKERCYWLVAEYEEILNNLSPQSNSLTVEEK